MIHSSQLNAYNISIHMYLTIQHILNLSHTLNLNHNVIIPKQHVITPYESYTHHTLLIYTWHKHIYELCNTHNYSIIFKIILTRSVAKWFNSSGSTMDPITILVAEKLIALKGSYNCVIAQVMAHNSIHAISQYTCISQFNTHSIYHLYTISIKISWSQHNNLSC